MLFMLFLLVFCLDLRGKFQKNPVDQYVFSNVSCTCYTYPNISPKIAKADIQFTFPVAASEEEELRLILNWKPALMSDLAKEASDENASINDDEPQDVAPGADGAGLTVPPVELLMFALPHHHERIRATVGSSNEVKKVGCQTTLHGLACPVSFR